MHVDFNISQSEQGKFKKACEAAIGSVGNGSKKGTIAAGEAILVESMMQCPVDTGALQQSSFLGVGRRDVKGYRYGAIIGYGKPAGMAGAAGMTDIKWLSAPYDVINEKNGKPASYYASRVHEDLDMQHPRGGKAKFLEDPIRSWAAGNFAQTAMTYWRREIIHLNTRAPQMNRMYRGSNNVASNMWLSKKTHSMHRTQFVSFKSDVQGGDV